MNPLKWTMNGWNAVAVIKHVENYPKPVHLGSMNKIPRPTLPTYNTKHSRMQVHGSLRAYWRLAWQGCLLPREPKIEAPRYQIKREG